MIYAKKGAENIDFLNTRESKVGQEIMRRNGGKAKEETFFRIYLAWYQKSPPD